MLPSLPQPRLDREAGKDDRKGRVVDKIRLVVLAGPERSPLPDRGLRGPPTNPRRGQPPHRLASGPAVAAGTQVQEHPAALPLDFVVILSLAQ
jgi:hypothetical protein